MANPRIVEAKLYSIALPYVREVQWASLSEAAAPTIILRLTTDAGVVGVGEVTGKVRWTGMTFGAIATALSETFFPMLDGLDIGEEAAFPSRAKSIPENTAAKALVGNALCDLRAALSGLPFWLPWNGSGNVPMTWVLTRQLPSLMAREAADMVERYGFSAIKLKGGQGIQTDVDAVRDVRRAVGAHVRIFVDANNHYSALSAPDYLRALDGEGVCAVEDPYPLFPNSEFSRIQDESPVPLIVDTNARSSFDADSFLEHGAQAIEVKPGFIGLSEARAIANRARERGCRVHVGIGGEGAIGSLAALAKAPELTAPLSWIPAETSFFLFSKDHVLLDPLVVRDGNVQLPDAHSIAALVDWERVERLALSEPIRTSWPA